MTLNELGIGYSAEVRAVGGEGALRRHFLDMGLTPGTTVTLIKLAPLGDPMQLRLRGYELTLRLEDAKKIEISEPFKDNKDKNEKAAHPAAGSDNGHPGLGEEGKFHPKGSGDPLPKDAKLSFALVGNQNSGKTTLFNRLTGSNAHVGNFPGVTVDRKDGAIKNYPNTVVTDLPGIYSLSPYSNEEIVSRNFVLDEKPTAIINIVDATNIERNLYLTMQLLELGTPMVIALNIMDELTASGGTVDINALEMLLGVPVVPISAAKNEGVDELVRHALHIAHYQEKPARQDFCSPDGAMGGIHRCLHAVVHLIEHKAAKNGVPVRFAASKLVEGDDLIVKRLDLSKGELDMIETVVHEMENRTGLDRCAAIAEMRFSFIQRICSQTVVKPGESRETVRSSRIDKILTGKWTAIPIFIFIMGLISWLTFEVIGGTLQSLMESGLNFLTELAKAKMQSAGVNEVLTALVTDGIFAGVGSVLSFLPIIITLFFFLSLLEDSGYLARVAFFMDKMLRKIGLSGRSIVPLLIGFGCTVPAVMSTRTLPSDRDRKMTILLTPFMSCTAKMPIYAFFADAFFENYKWLVLLILYLLGILVGIVIALIYKKTLFRGEAVPFVMELPNYRLPGAKNVALLLWDKAKDFLQRAFTVIFVSTIIVWFLQNFDIRLNLTENSEGSILSMISGFIAPAFAPAGLDSWEIVTALISGFMAKESVVSTLNVLYSGNITAAMSTLTAASLLVFSLLYTPCVAAIASVKRELGMKWAIAVVVWQCALAWIVSTIVFRVGSLIFLGHI